MQRIWPFNSFRDARTRLLFWATLASLVCGAIEFGEPAENFLRGVRNAISPRAASGDIVFVGIDDASIQQLGAWPWPRRQHAALLDQLKAQGAKRVFFDVVFLAATNTVDDTLFAQALARSKGTVTLATFSHADRILQKQTEYEPFSPFLTHARMASILWSENAFGEIVSLPYAGKLNKKSIPSFSSALARVGGPMTADYPVDYSVDIKSIPTVSAADVIQSKSTQKILAGKDVVIGVRSNLLGDRHRVLGKGAIAGAYAHIFGAETLRRGNPVDYGWFPALLAGILAAAGYLFFPRRSASYAALGAGSAALLILPFVLERQLIFVDSVPGILLLGIVSARWSWMRYKKHVSGSIVSGLPNLYALRTARVKAGAVIVAARIHNFARITSALPPQMEKELVQQITNRLMLGALGAQVYQGDEGIFVWLHQDGAGDVLEGHLAGLHALFSNSLQVGERQIDLDITFGLDGDDDRSLTNRIGSALVAAAEAVTTGAKWKRFDPARHVDDDWKLSLLGSLDTAIADGDVWVAYQPKLAIADNRLTGAEALVRWTHPEKGNISPAEFVLAAEQHDRIENLTLHVLNDAIKSAALMNNRGVEFDVAVNLSARLLDRKYFPGLVDNLLKRHALPASKLTLEITESAAIVSKEQSVDTLHRLRQLGINISIDDYGTGLSTLEYLRTIPATEIKIDRSFVAAIATSHSDKVMVNSTIELAHRLGLKVVAEGIETQEILTMLTQMGCDVAQGYHIARPMRFQALATLILGDTVVRAA